MLGQTDVSIALHGRLRKDGGSCLAGKDARVSNNSMKVLNAEGLADELLNANLFAPVVQHL